MFSSGENAVKKPTEAKEAEAEATPIKRKHEAGSDDETPKKSKSSHEEGEVVSLPMLTFVYFKLNIQEAEPKSEKKKKEKKEKKEKKSKEQEKDEE